MQEKTIEIVAPEGYEVDKEKSSFEKIVFRALPEELPRTWEGLNMVKGFWVASACNIYETIPDQTLYSNRNIWPAREEAEASIALAQLCQLRDRYNGGWKPNWVRSSDKFCISFYGGDVHPYEPVHFHSVLTFKTPELRDEFMKNFADLIEKAKPLLG